jgi:hypothetical protein
MSSLASGFGGAMGGPKHSQFSVIGKDISWDELDKHNKSGLLRATHFARFASIEGDKVKAKSLTMPYGVLIIECLELKSSFTLHITHRLDFLHLWYAYDWCQNSEAQEIVLRDRAERFQSFTGRDDFLKLYSRVWGTRELEVLVARFVATQQVERKWVRKLFGAILPSLVVLVCPKGYLERVVLDDWKGLDGLEWSVMFEPLAQFKPQI